MSDNERMTLTDFLLARVEEDEAAARDGGSHNYGGVFARDNYGCLLVQPARVLAECAAKRAIIELHDALEDKGWQSGKDHAYLWCGSCGTLDDAPVPYPCETLETLATVYRDHPDYQPGWDV